jgi:hypothetical protein
MIDSAPSLSGPPYVRVHVSVGVSHETARHEHDKTITAKLERNNVLRSNEFPH